MCQIRSISGMEELALIEKISISLTSNQLKSLQLDIFTNEDEIIASTMIDSQTPTLLDIHSIPSSFNCLIYNESEKINSQFEVLLLNTQWVSDQLIITKDFEGFCLTFLLEKRNRSKFKADQERQNRLFEVNMAKQTLFKVRSRVIKRMEIEELKKKNKFKNKSNLKNNGSIRNRSNKTMTAFFIKPIFKEYLEPIEQKPQLQTLRCLDRLKLTEHTDVEDEASLVSMPKLKKTRTLIEKSQQISQSNLPQTDMEIQDINNFFIKIENISTKQILKTKENSKTKSMPFDRLLERRTIQDLNNQKVALQLIRQMASGIKQSRSTYSGKTQNKFIKKISSPYLLKLNSLPRNTQ